MGGVLQTALGGGRALLVGWFLPSLVNVLVFGLVVLPDASGLHLLATADGGEIARATIFVLVCTAVLGLVLAALQTPLYRLLEGYLGWPERWFQAGRRRQLARKHLLANRIDAVRLVALEAAARLSDEQRTALAEFRAHPVTSRYVDADARRGPVWLSLLDERLHRYPKDDTQVTPTRLGNAIRRFEEYGYDRYRLDSQVLWHELNAVATEATRKQAEDGRTNVDFFVSLLYGHLLVACAALVALCSGQARTPWLAGVTIAVLLVLAALWYRVAVVATDEWAGGIRAMVNLTRRPLADSLGLKLPADPAEERTMWTVTTQLVATNQPEAAERLAEYRTE